MSSDKLAIWWIRRDLRLTDNEALHAAQAHGGRVVPLFILDPFFEESPYVGAKRWAFMLAGLRALDEDLRAKNGRLLLRRGAPEEALAQLVEETGATAVFAEEDHSNYARRRDRRVAEAVPLQLVGGTAIRPPGTVCKQDGDPYIVYTPFKNTWKDQSLPRRSDLAPAPQSFDVPEIDGEALPDAPQVPEAVAFPAGEAEARRRLEAFVADKIYAYDERRDRIDQEGTAQLSPYLRFGMISAREAAVTAVEAISDAPDKDARAGAQVWLDELIWRDFYIHILHHFPRVSRTSFREEYEQIEWRNDEDAFDAWRNGRTGYPLVDAAMRQLSEAGWIHNRARMVVASFLVKDLLIDWRWGERWFMQQLVDGDPAANNGGWQWSAGTGTDAAPYFRIFNPISQSKKHDPDGRFIRRWVPELADVTDEYIHEPWTMPAEEQKRVGCAIGEDYPAPIVDHQEARERTLAAYKTAREAA